MPMATLPTKATFIPTRAPGSTLSLPRVSHPVASLTLAFLELSEEGAHQSHPSGPLSTGLLPTPCLSGPWLYNPFVGQSLCEGGGLEGQKPLCAASGQWWGWGTGTQKQGSQESRVTVGWL